MKEGLRMLYIRVSNKDLKWRSERRLRSGWARVSVNGRPTMLRYRNEWLFLRDLETGKVKKMLVLRDIDDGDSTVFIAG